MPTRWRLQTNGGCGFDCPNQPYFRIEPGFGNQDDPAVLQRIQELDSVRPPSVAKQYMAMPVFALGIMVMFAGPALIADAGLSFLDIDGLRTCCGGASTFIGFGLVLFGLLLMNLFQQWELRRYISRLTEVCSRPSEGSWNLQLEFRCHGNGYCYTGYRDFLGRKAIFVMYCAPGEAAGGYPNQGYAPQMQNVQHVPTIQIPVATQVAQNTMRPAPTAPVAQAPQYGAEAGAYGGGDYGGQQVEIPVAQAK